MSTLTIIVVVVAVLVLVGLALSVRVVQQHERGVLFRLGRVVGVREPGLRLILPLVEVLRRVSLRIVTMPIQSQGIITHDNVSTARGQAATTDLFRVSNQPGDRCATRRCCRSHPTVEAEVAKTKAGCWTRWRAFAQVRQGSNIQLLPFPLVSAVLTFS
jgi:hypothetical protein